MLVLAPKNGDQCFSTTPLRLKPTWTAGSLSGLQSIINFSVEVITIRTRVALPRPSKFSIESAWKCTCCMSRPRKASLSLETLSQVNMPCSTTSSRDTPRSSLFKIRPSWLTLIFPKSGCWLQVSKSSATFSSQAALKEWRPCASWRTCRAALPLPSKEAQTPAPIVPANSRCDRGRYLCLTLAGCMLLPVVGVQEQLLQIPQASLHKCSPATQTLPLWTQQFPLAAFVAPSLLQWTTHSEDSWKTRWQQIARPYGHDALCHRGSSAQHRRDDRPVRIAAAAAWCQPDGGPDLSGQALQLPWSSCTRRPGLVVQKMDVLRTQSEDTKWIYWLVVDLPLWKIWLRQLGWWNSQHMGK